jgi:hypothetical protein
MTTKYGNGNWDRDRNRDRDRDRDGGGIFLQIEYLTFNLHTFVEWAVSTSTGKSSMF